MKDIENIQKDYKEFAILHWKASREGDHKTANKNYSKLTKIYKMFLNNEDLKKVVLPILLNDSNYSVQAWAASHCLGLGIYKEEAVAKLEEISRKPREKAPSFEAKTTLEVWREKGTLTF